MLRRPAGVGGAISKRFEGVEHKMSEASLGLVIDFLRTRLPVAAAASAMILARC